MNNSNKKALVFVFGGLGDTVLLIPLIKRLKERDHTVTALVTNSFGGYELLRLLSLCDTVKFILKKEIHKWVFWILTRYRYFDRAYLNHLAVSKKSLMIALLTSKQITTHRKSEGLPSFMSSHVEDVAPLGSCHDAVENLRLFDPSLDNTVLNEDLLSVSLPETIKEDFLKKRAPWRFFLDRPYVLVKPSAGNNIITYKNWPIPHWKIFLRYLSKTYPGYHFILLGDRNESVLEHDFLSEKLPNVISLIGQTSIEDLLNLVSLSRFFIGVDGGIMHIAAFLRKPTFTLWGPTDFRLYGYEGLNPKKHKCVFQNIWCRPCSVWIHPNRKRVSRPEECPDKICLAGLMPDTVIKEFDAFFEKINLV